MRRKLQLGISVVVACGIWLASGSSASAAELPEFSKSFKAFTQGATTTVTLATASKSVSLKCREHAAKFEGTAPKTVSNFILERSECESAGAECRSESIIGRVRRP